MHGFEGDFAGLNALLQSDSPWLIVTASVIDSPGHIAATARFADTAGPRAVILGRVAQDPIQHGFGAD